MSIEARYRSSPEFGQLWAYGAPLVVRLGFFAFGVLAWATYRSNGTWVANLALLISQAGLWSFLFAIVPFLPLDGYSWLAIYFGQPMLRQKALIALNAKLRGKKLPPNLRRDELPLLIFFAIGFFFTIIAFGLGVLIVAAAFLTRSLQGVGFVIFLMLVAVFVVWYLNFRAMRPQRLRQQVNLLRATKAGRTNAAQPQTAPARSPWARRFIVLGGVGVALIVVAFLPYAYDTAGPFEILPSQGSEVTARTDGQVVDVMVHEGDRVDAGRVLAHLSSADQQRDVGLTREELARAETRLGQLQKQGSDQELVEEARGEVERLHRQLDNDEAQLDRTTLRAPVSGLVMTPNPQFLTGAWLNAGDKFIQIADTKVLDAEIEIPQDDIALVKRGAKVRLRPWSERDQEIVGHVISVAPAGADIAEGNTRGAAASAANTGNLMGAARIRQEPSATPADENSSAVDADELATNVGARWRRALSRRELAQSSEEKTDSIGAIRVKVSVPNAKALLRPNMTGYAKISGPDMRVGQAYLRLGIRFFTVELWSWVP